MIFLKLQIGYTSNYQDSLSWYYPVRAGKIYMAVRDQNLGLEIIVVWLDTFFLLNITDNFSDLIIIDFFKTTNRIHFKLPRLFELILPSAGG